MCMMLLGQIVTHCEHPRHFSGRTYVGISAHVAWTTADHRP